MRKQIFAAFLLLLLCSGCTETNLTDEPTDKTDAMSEKSENAVSKDMFAMDTYMNLTAYGKGAENAINAAASYIEEMDALLSTGRDTSEISQLNSSGLMTLSSDSATIMKYAIEIYDETDGAFNPLMYPIMEAWGFPSKEYRVPEKAELEQLLTLTDVSQINFDAATGSVSFGISGMKIDLGGIAKGYTSSQIRDIFASCGVTSGMVSLGGNVQVIGTKTDGSMWRVGVQNPDRDGDYLGILEVQDKAVITSGGYERYFEQDGETYHHIIDPADGYPAKNGLASVTIVSEDGTLADSLSTALYVMGQEKASAYWREHSEQFDAILLTDQGNLYVTEGIQDIFTSSYDWEIIKEGN